MQNWKKSRSSNRNLEDTFFHSTICYWNGIVKTRCMHTFAALCTVNTTPVNVYSNTATRVPFIYVFSCLYNRSYVFLAYSKTLIKKNLSYNYSKYQWWWKIIYEVEKRIKKISKLKNSVIPPSYYSSFL